LTRTYTGEQQLIERHFQGGEQLSDAVMQSGKFATFFILHLKNFSA
jgi:hypothetical protein